MVLGMDRAGLAAFFGLSITMSVFRTWRYVVLLRVSGLRAAKFSLFLVVIVRNLFSDLLPARLGTLIYIYLVNTRLGIPFASATSSFATAFLFDILVLAPLIVIAAIFATGIDSFSPLAIVVAGSVLGLICIALYRLMPVVIDFMGRSLGRLALLGPAMRERLSMLAADTSAEVRRYQSAGIYGRLVLLSLGVRIAKYGSLYCLLYALLAPRGFTLSELEIPGVFLGLVVPELAASLPISGIAGFGAYEGAWVLIFQLLGFPANLAELTSLAHHGFTQVYGYSLGLLALLLLLMLRPVRTAPQGWQRP